MARTRDRRIVFVSALAVVLGAAGRAGAQSKSYALVTTPAKRVRAELTYQFEAPGLSAREWEVFTPRLIPLPGQTEVSSALEPGASPPRS